MIKKTARSKAIGILVSLFATISLILLFSTSAAAYSGHGNGTADDPYQITSNTFQFFQAQTEFSELNEIRNDLFAHYILMTDLDLGESDALWKPVGDVANPFSGTFNGNMKNIKNLNVSVSDHEYYAGLFGSTSENAVIFDLTLINATAECKQYTGLGDAGSLVGYNRGDIVNCRTVNAFVSSNWRSGGLVGANFGGTIENCSAEGTIIGIDSGGLVGINVDGIIKTSYSNASVTGPGSTGGFISRNYNGSISNCISEGSVYGDYTAGGFAGCNVQQGIIEFCYTKSTVDAKTQTGGFVGVNQGYMNNCISINGHINNRPMISKESSPYPPYTKYVFGSGGPVGRIAHSNYYPGFSEDYTAKIENCYSWKETKTNRWRFGAVNGEVVKTADLKSFPESVWSEWDQLIWEKGEDGFPVIKQMNLP